MHLFSFNRNRNTKAQRVLLLLFVLSTIGAALLLPEVAWAQDRFGVNFGANAGLGTQDVRETIVNIIRISLGILGVVALIIILYGGFVWMTAGGRQERIDQAKKILINATIGLVIIFMAFALVQYIFNTLQGTSGGLGGGACTPGQCTRCAFICDASGNEIPSGSCNTPALCGVLPGGDMMTIRWSSPAPGASDWPLCSIIQANFSHNVDASTVNDSSVVVTVANATLGNGTSCSVASDCRSGVCSGSCVGDSVAGTRDVTGPLVVFRPNDNYLSGTDYRVVVESGGSGVFSDLASGVLPLDRTYDWVFTTGSTADTQPPTVVLVDPLAGSTDICRATPVQAQFSEPMDVSTLLRTGANPNDTTNTNSLTLTPDLPPAATWSKSAPAADTLSAAATVLFDSTTSYTPNLDADVIADSCGNLLDGDGDGVAEQSAGGDDVSWQFTTGTTSQCTPEIASVVPSFGLYNDEIVISGNHFTAIANDVVFASNVYSDSSCFDGSFFPGNACVVSWTDDQVRVRVPAGGGNSNGAISGDVQVDVAGVRSNGVFFDVTSPHINSGPFPRQGGAGQYVSLSGARFGTAVGTVYLKSVTSPAVEFAFEPTDCAVSTWGDTSVVVKVPTSALLDTYYVQLEDASGNRSNLGGDTFTVTSDAPGPGICSAAPSCGEVGTTVALTGVRFGSSGTLTFGGTPATPSAWSDTAITVDAPAGISTGNNPIVVQATGNLTPSNSMPFTSPCGLGAQCDADTTTPSCDLGACGSGFTCSAAASCTCVVAPQVSSVAPTCATSCPTAQIEVVFNMNMDPGSVSDSTVDVLPCADVDCTIFASEIGYTSLGLDPTDPSRLLINPSAPLVDDPALTHDYRVIVRNAVLSDAGIPLSGLNYDADAIPGNDSYSWVFGVSAASCSLTGVTISPVAATSDQLGQNITFVSGALGSNGQCGTQSVNPWTLDWNWSSLLPGVAGITNADANTDTLVDPLQVATTASEGSTQITAASGAFSAIATLDVDVVTCNDTTDCSVGGACPASVCDETTRTCTPVITGLSPNNGPVGRWTTVSGCYFGSSQGTGSVTFDATPAQFPACGGGTWTNSQIIVEVPNVAGAQQVRVNTDRGLASNTQGFTVTNDCNGVPVPPSGVPGVCRLRPTTAAEGDTVVVEGENFGTSADTVTYAGTLTPRIASTVSNWTDTSVDTEVPTNVADGDVILEVNSCEANGVAFTVFDPPGGIGDSCNGTPAAAPPQCTQQDSLCQAGLFCDPNHAVNPCTCQTAPAPAVSGIVPANSAANVCRNVAVQVTFNQVMSGGTVLGAVSLENTAGDVIPTTKSVTYVDADVSGGIDSILGDDTMITLSPLSVLDEATEYRIRVTVDALSAYGVALPAEYLQAPGFTTGNDVCQVDFVEVIVSPPGTAKNEDIFFCAGRDDCPGDAARGLDPLGQPDGSVPTIAGNQHFWQAQAYSGATTPVSPVAVDFYLWEEDDTSNLYSILNGSGGVVGESNVQDVYISADARTNGTGSVSVGAHSETAGNATTSVALLSSMCDRPWPSNAEGLYRDGSYNFSFWYCRDVVQEYVCTDPVPMRGQPCSGPSDTSCTCNIDTSDDLPALRESFSSRSNESICNVYSGNAGAVCSGGGDCTRGAACIGNICNAKSANGGSACVTDADCTSQSACTADLLQDNLILFEDTSIRDALGLRVFRNSDHLSSEGWYDAFALQPGGLSTPFVSGYKAVQSGRSTYVNAANVAGSIYTNIYLLSYSEGASDATRSIYTQILNNWRFNTNITNMVTLGQLRRDTQRIGDLGAIIKAAERYRGENGDYPALVSGSFLKGISTSKWTQSWNGTLGSLGLPSDPLNHWGASQATDALCTYPPGESVPENQCGVNANGNPICCNDSTSTGTGAQCSVNRCALCPVGYDPVSCWNHVELEFYCPADSHVYLYAYNAGSIAAYGNLEYTSGSWDGLSTGSYNPCSGGSSCSCFNVQVN